MSQLSADGRIADKSTRLPSKNTNQNISNRKNTPTPRSKPILTDPPNIFDIQVAVAQRYGISLTSFRDRDRVRRVTYPAQIAMYLSYKMTNHSYREVGWQFGNRSSVAVLRATRLVEERIAADPELAEVVKILRSLIKAQTGVSLGNTQSSS